MAKANTPRPANTGKGQKTTESKQPAKGKNASRPRKG